MRDVRLAFGPLALLVLAAPEAGKEQRAGGRAGDGVDAEVARAPMPGMLAFAPPEPMAT